DRAGRVVGQSHRRVAATAGRGRLVDARLDRGNGIGRLIGDRMRGRDDVQVAAVGDAGRGRVPRAASGGILVYAPTRVTAADCRNRRPVEIGRVGARIGLDRIVAAERHRRIGGAVGRIGPLP